MEQVRISAEICFYFAVYILYLIFGLWTMIKARRQIWSVAIFDLAPGWFGDLPFDDSNDELQNFNAYIRWWWPWYLLHAVTSSFIQIFNLKKASWCLAAASITALLFTVQPIFVLVLVLQLLTYCIAVITTNSKSLIWILSCAWMIIINLIKHSNWWYMQLGYTEYFTLIVTLSWSLLRCCSFALNYINAERDYLKGARNEEKLQLYTIENFVGYVMYFPCLVYGPFLSFPRYAAALQSKKADAIKTFQEACGTLLRDLLRVSFWWLFLHVALHFLYIHYMARDASALQLVTPSFGRHAVGYFMGQFFFLYYIITYGLGIAFATFDGMQPPSRPRCIGRIHFYSDMWKYFDEGLYEFLFKHIYAEVCRRDSSVPKKLLAVLITFAFVFIWHGCYQYVLIWAVLNLGCLLAEKCFKALIFSQKYCAFLRRSLALNDNQIQRLNALLATQIFIPAAFSNIYFISGQEVGDQLMSNAYTSGVLNYLALTFCSYCFFQCSEFLSKKQSLVKR